MTKIVRTVLGLCSLATACGPAPDTASITLMTGLENENHLKNLMSGFTEPNALVATSSTCIQRGLFSGLETDHDSHEFVTYPIEMATPLVDGTVDTEAAWITTHATFPPVKFKVPKGKEVGFGVIGSFVQPRSVAPDGSCSEVDPQTQVPYPTYSIIGHRNMTVSSDAIIPLKVWVLKSTSTPAPPADPNACTDTQDNDDKSQTCASRNFLRVKCMNCAQGQGLKVEYFFGTTRNEHVIQFFTGSDLMSTTGVAIPDTDDAKLTVLQNQVEVGTRPLNSKSFNNANTTGLSISTGPGADVYFQVSRHGGTALTPIVPVITTNGLAGTLSWNPFPGANSYKVFTGSSTATALTNATPVSVVNAPSATLNLFVNGSTFVTLQPFDLDNKPLAPRLNPEEIVPINYATTALGSSNPSKITLYPNGTAAIAGSITITTYLLPALTTTSTATCSAWPCPVTVTYPTRSYYYRIQSDNTHHGHFDSGYLGPVSVP